MPVTIQITVHTVVDGWMLVVPDRIRNDSRDIITEAKTTTKPRMRKERLLLTAKGLRPRDGRSAFPKAWLGVAIASVMDGD